EPLTCGTRGPFAEDAALALTAGAEGCADAMTGADAVPPGVTSGAEGAADGEDGALDEAAAGGVSTTGSRALNTRTRMIAPSATIATAVPIATIRLFFPRVR